VSRSYLFIPGNTPSMIQNLDVFESDAFESEYFLKDIKYTNDLPIKGYVLPKASKEAVDALNLLTDKEIIPIIESPLALINLSEIAQSKNVYALLLGAEDYTKELGINRTLDGTEILYARSIIAITANAYNISSIDTPYTSKDDEEGLLIDSNNAKNLGFTSKSSIHPNQVDIINKVFSPSNEEILEAKRIIKKSEETKKGAFSLDGKMIDLPIIEKARKVLELTKKYNL